MTGNTAKNSATGPLLSGTWFVEWTDEKEIVFLLQKGFFGLATGMAICSQYASLLWPCISTSSFLTLHLLI
jgi:hypothetical protein